MEQILSEFTTPHLADACLRAGLPVRCAPASLHAVVPGSRASGRVRPVQHVGSVDIFLEALPHDRVPDIVALARQIRDTEAHQAQTIAAGTTLRRQLSLDESLSRRRADPSYDFRRHLRAIGGAVEE
jgi:hypothetical protein